MADPVPALLALTQPSRIPSTPETPSESGVPALLALTDPKYAPAAPSFGSTAEAVQYGVENPNADADWLFGEWKKARAGHIEKFRQDGVLKTGAGIGMAVLQAVPGALGTAYRAAKGVGGMAVEAVRGRPLKETAVESVADFEAGTQKLGDTGSKIGRLVGNAAEAFGATEDLSDEEQKKLFISDLKSWNHVRQAVTLKDSFAAELARDFGVDTGKLNKTRIDEVSEFTDPTLFVSFGAGAVVETAAKAGLRTLAKSTAGGVLKSVAEKGLRMFVGDAGKIAAVDAALHTVDELTTTAAKKVAQKGLGAAAETAAKRNPLFAALVAGGSVAAGVEPSTALVYGLLGHAATKRGMVTAGARAVAGPLGKFAQASLPAIKASARGAVAGTIGMAPFALSAEDPEQFASMLAAGGTLGAAGAGTTFAADKMRIGSFFRTDRPMDKGPKIDVADFGSNPDWDAAHRSATEHLTNESHNFVESIRQFVKKSTGREVYVLDDAAFGVVSESYGQPNRVQGFVTPEGDKAFVHLSQNAFGHEAIGHLWFEALDDGAKQSILDSVSTSYTPEQFADFKQHYTNKLANSFLASEHSRGQTPNLEGAVTRASQLVNDEYVAREIIAENASAILSSIPPSQFGQPIGFVRGIHLQMERMAESMGLSALFRDRPNTPLGLQPAPSLANTILNVATASRLETDITPPPARFQIGDPIDGRGEITRVIPGEQPVYEVRSKDGKASIVAEKELLSPAAPVPELLKVPTPSVETTQGMRTPTEANVTAADGTVIGTEAEVKRTLGAQDGETYLEVEYTDPTTGQRTTSSVPASRLSAPETVTPAPVVPADVPVEPVGTVEWPKDTAGEGIEIGQAPEPIRPEAVRPAPLPEDAQPAIPENQRGTGASLNRLIGQKEPLSAAEVSDIRQSVATVGGDETRVRQAYSAVKEAVAGGRPNTPAIRMRMRVAETDAGRINPLTRETEQLQRDAGQRGEVVETKLIVPTSAPKLNANGTLTFFGFDLSRPFDTADRAFRFAKERGVKLPYSGVKDPAFASDLAQYTQHHANGYLGDGRPFPVNLAAKLGVTPTKGYRPVPLAAERTAFLNLVAGSLNTSSERAVSTAKAVGGKVFQLDEEGTRFETNPLRQRFRELGAPAELLSDRNRNTITAQFRLDRIDAIEGGTDVGFRPPNTLAIEAGFMPEVFENEVVPNMPFRYRGVWELIPGEKMRMFDALEDIHGADGSIAIGKFSTVDAQALRQLGFELPELSDEPMQRREYSAFSPETEEFKRWFGDSKVVDDEGKPLRVYHGSTHEFNAFDRSKANTEGAWGAGFYFSDTPTDASANYSGEGPDLRSRIDREAERLQNQNEELSYEEARAQVSTKLKGSAGALVYPTYLKMERPFVLGNGLRKETYLEGRDVKKFFKALEEESAGFDGADASQFVADTADYGWDYDGVRATDLVKAFEQSEAFTYTEDENGNFVRSELLRRVLQRTGFDGVIDQDVPQKFGPNKRVGKPMDGVDYDTTHYIVFKPTQIKSATGNRGTYDPKNPDIRYMPTLAELAQRGTIDPDEWNLRPEVSAKLARPSRDTAGRGRGAAVVARNEAAGKSTRSGQAVSLSADGKKLKHAVPGSKPLSLIHWSGQQGLSVVDPNFHGKGVANPRDFRGTKKSYFFEQGTDYGQDTGLVTGHGKAVYGAKVARDRIYNANRDVLGYWDQINQYKADKMLQEAGYAGFAVERGDGARVVVTYEPVEVRPLESDKTRFAPEDDETSAIGVAPLRTQKFDSLRSAPFDGEAYQALRGTADRVFQALGLKARTGNAVGGWVDTESGYHSRETSLRFQTKDAEKAKLAGALLGLLAPDVQNAVYVARYDAAGPHHEAEYTFRSPDDLQKAADRLAEFGLPGYTALPETNQLIVATRDVDSDANVRKFTEALEQDGLEFDSALTPADIQFPETGDLAGILRQARGQAEGEPVRNDGRAGPSPELAGLIDEALARIPQDKTAFAPEDFSKVSTVSILDGTEPVQPQEGALAIGRHLADRARKGTRIPFDSRTKTARDTIAATLADELAYAVGRNKSGVGWYEAKISEAMDLLAEVHPELRDEPEMKSVYTAILSITSNGQRVVDNFRQAEKLYSNWKETGKIDSTSQYGGARNGSINAGLQLLQKMIDQHGLTWTKDFLSKEFRFGDLKKIAKETLGLDLASSELADTPVNGSIVFGPKVGGGFYQNLNGNFRPITMDLWLMRTWNRINGSYGQPDRPGMSRGIDRLRTAAQEIVDAGPENPEHSTASEILQMSDQRLINWAEKRYTEWERVRKFKNPTPLDRPAKGLTEARQGAQEAPRNGSERAWVREVFGRVDEILQEKGLPAINNADKQAILWYYEKELYSRHGYKEKSNAGQLDYADAARLVLESRRRGE